MSSSSSKVDSKEATIRAKRSYKADNSARTPSGNQIPIESKSKPDSGTKRRPGSTESVTSPMRKPPGMKTGGLIKETGTYTLHKGEVVVPASRVKSVDMSLKKDKKKPLKK